MKNFFKDLSSKFSATTIQYFIGILLRLAYWTRIRQLWNKFCQWKYDQKERTPLPIFNTPEEIEEYIHPKFQYRHDPLGGLMDYHSEAEVFHWRLLDPEIPDDDCDGYHHFVAVALSTVEGVECVFELLSGFRNSGHATVVYRYKNRWYHFDYKISQIPTPNVAPTLVAKKYTKKDLPVEATWWVFETINMKPIAISPSKL